MINYEIQLNSIYILDIWCNLSYKAAASVLLERDAQVAQLVEQRTENPRVGGSIPPLGTTFPSEFVRFSKFYLLQKTTPLSSTQLDT